MILAIFGGSLVGKTTAASSLATELSMDVRHCGDVVKQTAARMGVSLGELSEDMHRAIDEETRQWVAARSSGCIVEGRFLDAVLRPGNSLVFVRLTADVQTRAARRDLTERDVMMRDLEDATFRKKMFTASVPPISYISLDNSGMSVAECVSEVIKLVGTTPPHV